jgi:hypothetical protein
VPIVIQESNKTQITEWVVKGRKYAKINRGTEEIAEKS